MNLHLPFSSTDTSQPALRTEGTSWHGHLLPQWAYTSKGMLIFSAVALIIASGALLLIRTAFPVAPHYLQSGQKIDKPLTITLSQHLGSLPTEDIVISPKLEGTWQYRQGTILSNDQVVFVPADSFAVNTIYTVTFPTASRLLGGQAEIEPIRFMTERAPNIITYGFSALTDGATIAADQSFEVKLASPSRGLRDLELRSQPAAEFTLSDKDDTTFAWKPNGLLPQGQSIKLEIFDRKSQESLATKTLAVAAEPVVNELAKKTLVGATEVTNLTFSESVDPEFASSISIDTEGQVAWASDTIYSLTPKGLEAGKTYTFTVKAGLRSKAGGILTTDQTRTFSTVGPVSVLTSSPHGSRLTQASQQISFTFDQPVDHPSVESRFSITSGTVTKISWKDATFMATVTNLGYQRTVTAKLAPGIINTGFGLPSSQTFSTSFTTEVRTARLNIPLYMQQHSATCAVASLRMALAYKGISADEMTIVGRMGYNPTAMDTSTNPPTWDDPYQMFVGSIDGKIKDRTGAGPDAPPVAKAAKSFGVDAEAVTGISINWVAQQIYNGSPVILFGSFNNTSELLQWQTPTGRQVVMNISSHARIVTGVQGEPGNPLGFWVHDPLSGSDYWSAASLAHNITLDPERQAVVIR